MAGSVTKTERGDWIARLTVSGKQHTLGRYPSEAEARLALRTNQPPEGAMKEPQFVPVPSNWKDLKHHPYASIIPMFEGMDWEGFKSSIRQGYIHRNPIVLYRDNPKEPWRILNGRHCHMACVEENVTPNFVGLENDDEAARRIAMMDANRRHLSVSQRAMMAVTLNQQSKALYKKGQSQEEIAEASGISRPIINDAVKVSERGSPKLKDAVVDGTISVADAAKVVNETPGVQGLIVDRVKSGSARTARQARQSIPREREPGDDTESEAEARRRHQSNGKPFFDWKKFNAIWNKLYLEPDNLCRPYGGAKDGPKAEGLRRLLMEFKKNFKALAKELSKSEPPE